MKTTKLTTLANDFEREARELEGWAETPVNYDGATGQTCELDEIDAEKWEAARGCAITALKQMAEKLRTINRRIYET